MLSCSCDFSPIYDSVHFSFCQFGVMCLCCLFFYFLNTFNEANWWINANIVTALLMMEIISLLNMSRIHRITTVGFEEGNLAICIVIETQKGGIAFDIKVNCTRKDSLCVKKSILFGKTSSK